MGYVAPLIPTVLLGHDRVKAVRMLLNAAGEASPLLSAGVAKGTHRQWQAAAEIRRHR